MRAVLLCTAFLLLFATPSHTNKCELIGRNMDIEVSEGCTVNVGTQKYCKSNGHLCVSLHQFGSGLSSGVTSTKHAYHCVVSSHNVVSGTLTQSEIRAEGGDCSSHSGSANYKFANATGCSCVKKN